MANVSSITVANAFLDLANQSGKHLTNMQLQKLVFLAQGYSLAILNRPMHYNNTHAWQWGPVIPILYKNLQKYGNGLVSEHIVLDKPEEGVLDVQDLALIQDVFNAYGSWTGSKLSALTHLRHTPWDITFTADPFGVIPNELMQTFYAEQLSVA